MQVARRCTNEVQDEGTLVLGRGSEVLSEGTGDGDVIATGGEDCLGRRRGVVCAERGDSGEEPPDAKGNGSTRQGVDGAACRLRLGAGDLIHERDRGSGTEACGVNGTLPSVDVEQGRRQNAGCDQDKGSGARRLGVRGHTGRGHCSGRRGCS